MSKFGSWTLIEDGGYPGNGEEPFIVRLECDGEDEPIWAEAWVEGEAIVTQWSHSSLASKMRITHWMPGPDVEVAA